MSDTFTVTLTKEELFVTMIAVGMYQPVSEGGPAIRDSIQDKLDAEWMTSPEALERWLSVGPACKNTCGEYCMKLPDCQRPKTCETFGCTTPGKQMCAIAPATNVWLCAECATTINATLERPMSAVGTATEADVDPALVAHRYPSKGEAIDST